MKMTTATISKTKTVMPEMMAINVLVGSLIERVTENIKEVLCKFVHKLELRKFT